MGAWYVEAWFWLLIVGIIIFIIGIIFYEIQRSNTVHAWVWIAIILGFALVIFSAIIFLLSSDLIRHRDEVIKEACKKHCGPQSQVQASPLVPPPVVTNVPSAY